MPTNKKKLNKKAVQIKPDAPASFEFPWDKTLGEIWKEIKPDADSFLEAKETAFKLLSSRDRVHRISNLLNRIERLYFKDEGNRADYFLKNKSGNELESLKDYYTEYEDLIRFQIKSIFDSEEDWTIIKLRYLKNGILRAFKKEKNNSIYFSSLSEIEIYIKILNEIKISILELNTIERLLDLLLGETTRTKISKKEESGLTIKQFIIYYYFYQNKGDKDSYLPDINYFSKTLEEGSVLKENISKNSYLIFRKQEGGGYYKSFKAFKDKISNSISGNKRPNNDSLTKSEIRGVKTNLEAVKKLIESKERTPLGPGTAYFDIQETIEKIDQFLKP